jgi:hypothetical protein
MKKYYLISILSLLLLTSFSKYSFGQEPPYLAPIPDQTAMVGELFTLDVNAINANPAETYQLTKALPGMTINASTGLISWTPVSETDGGMVTVRAYNIAGESERSFLIYLSDEIVCAEDIISYWKLDEASGTTFEDFKGGHTATTLNPVTPVAGRVAGAQLFEPEGMVDQYMYITDEGQYDLDRSVSFSISVWFKWAGEHNTEPNNHVLVARGNPEGSNMTILLFVDNTSNPNNPRFNFTLRPATTQELKSVSPNVTIQTDQWYHVVAIYHGSPNGQTTDLEVFINNQRSYYPHQFTDDDFVGYGAFDLNIGFWDAYESNRFPFNGSIDEVLFYRKALTSLEVSNMYNDGLNNIPHCKPGNYYPLITSTPVENASEGTPYTYTLTANDLDGGTLVKSADIIPSWLNFNPATGVLSGTPGNDDVGEAQVKLKVTDGTTDIFQEFTLTVSNVNDPPEITSTPTVTTIDQDEAFSYTLIAEDPDPDDVVTLSAPVLPSWMTFNPATGVLSGTPTNEQVQFADDSTFNITLAATDLADVTVTQEFTLTVVNVNDLPQIVSQANIQTDRNQAVTISINDLVVNDPDNVFPTDHTMTILAGDNYTFAGNTITPTNNFFGELLVNVQLSDGEGTVDYDFVITVNFVNIAPVFTSTPKTTGSEGAPYSYLIQVQDPDVAQTITITTPVLPGWLTFDDETNLLVGVPQRSDVGDNAVSIKVSDGALETFQNFTIVVKSSNNAPVIISSPPLQVNNYSQYTYIINATDADAADVLTYSAQLLPAWLTFDPATRTLSGIPEKSHVGTHNVILKVTDGYDEILQEFTITVIDVNTAPVVISVPEDTAKIDNQYTYLMEVVDYEGDNLTFTSTLVPAWLTFDPGSKVLSGTPVQANLGEHTVIITVTDGIFTVNHQFKIRVVPQWPISVPGFGTFSEKLYPNPASDFVIFEMRNENSVSLEITDITGKLVVSEKIEANTDKVQIDLSGVDDGVYIYRMFDGKQQQTGRLVVNKK